MKLRRRLFWKIGAVVFGGVAGVEPGASSFGSRFNIGKGVFLPAGGAGLRFMAPQYKLNMAVDYAVGERNSNALYVRLGEAF